MNLINEPNGGAKENADLAMTDRKPELNVFKKVYRVIRFWFYCYKEDPKYYCRYDEIVQGAYGRGWRDRCEMQPVIDEYGEAIADGEL